jgi:predicted amidohydrolase YtcJ
MPPAKKIKGRLIPGQLADMVVLERDPWDCPAEEISNIGVYQTIVGGRTVHGPRHNGPHPRAKDEA